jgi:tetratricopeptide (TPR) repeat protein
MKCENCGTENNFEWATFCANCQRPLRREIQAVAAQGSQEDNEAIPENPNIENSASESDEADGVEIRKSDPMDYVMGSSESETPTVLNQPQDSIKPESIEHELTLYRDDKVNVSISQDPTQLTVQTANDEIKITSAIMPEEEQTQDEADGQEPNVVKLNPPAVTEISDEQTQLSEPEKQFSTQKIRVDEASEKHEHQPLESSASHEPPGPVPELHELKQARGVVYLAGKDIRLTGGVKVAIGDEIKINDKVFEVKRPPGRSRWFYIGIIAAVAVLILSSLIIFTSSKDVGQLIGTVSTMDGRPLIGQGVRIVELNKTVSTNEAGFFIFSDIPAGIYTIDVQRSNGERIQDRISVVKDQTTTIALEESRPQQREVSQSVQAPPIAAERPSKTSKQDTRASSKGILDLNLDPSNASAYIDDKPLGVGSNSYKLDPGSYTLTIKKSGYKDSDQRIRIQSDKTLSLDISLSEETQARSKGNSEIAGDLEQAGNYREAMKYYDLALRSNSRDVNSLLGKARCARAEGKAEDAMTYYLQASRTAGDKGDVNSQIKALSGIIDMRPNTLTAYSSRGEIYYNLGQYDKAANDFIHVVEIDNRNLGAYYKLGDCYYKSKKYSDAIGAFTAAQELNFADPKAGVWLTKTYLAMGDKKNAKKAYENFKEIASYSARLEYKRDPEWQKVLAALGEKE